MNPANLPPLTGAIRGLLDGWCGPLRRVMDSDQPDVVTTGVVIATDGEDVLAYYDDRSIGFGRYYRETVTLDPARAEVRDHLIRWAATGERCPWCGGPGARDADRATADCGDCRGSGYLRPPHDLRWASDLFGPLSPEQSGAVLAWSVLSIARGGLPIAGVLGGWERFGLGARSRRFQLLRGGFPSDRPFAMTVEDSPPPSPRSGWVAHTPCVWTCHGPESGEEGRRAADASALTVGFALRDPGGLILPELPEVKS